MSEQGYKWLRWIAGSGLFFGWLDLTVVVITACCTPVKWIPLGSQQNSFVVITASYNIREDHGNFVHVIFALKGCDNVSSWKPVWLCMEFLMDALITWLLKWVPWFVVFFILRGALLLHNLRMYKSVQYIMMMIRGSYCLCA